MKKCLYLSVILLIMLCGCGRDASQLTVVTGIGVDGTPGAYQVGTEVIRLSGKDQETQSILLSADGYTVTDSIDSMVTMTGRSLYCNHAQVLVVGRETAEKGMDILLEELLRGTQYPVSLRIAVAKDTAAQIMEAKAVVSDLHSVEMEDMIRQGAAQCLTPDMDICHLYQDISTPGVEGVLPFLDLREDQGEQVCTLAGTALFRGASMITVLDQNDSRSLMWMRGHKGGTLVTKHGLLEVVYLDRQIKAGPEGAVLRLKLTLKADSDEESREDLIKETEQVLRQRFESLLRQLQALQCDAVGFGNRLYQTHKQEWDSLQQPWETVFAQYPIRVEVQVENVIWGRIWAGTETQQGEGRHGT